MKTKTLGLATAIFLAGSIFVGCNSDVIYGVGTITKERGTAQRIVESSGALFGNESVRFGDPNYVLDVNVTEIQNYQGNPINDPSRLGLYTISVRDHYKKPILALAGRLEEGDKVRFKIVDTDLTNYFAGKDKIGYNYSNYIELLEKGKLGKEIKIILYEPKEEK